jgi:hypothetical protein
MEVRPAETVKAVRYLPAAFFHSSILERKNHGRTGVGLPMVYDLAADAFLYASRPLPRADGQK